jgi:hypothetical protein
LAFGPISLSAHTPQTALPPLRTKRAQLMPQIPKQPNNIKFLVISKIAMQRISDK